MKFRFLGCLVINFALLMPSLGKANIDAESLLGFGVIKALIYGLNNYGALESSKKYSLDDEYARCFTGAVRLVDDSVSGVSTFGHPLDNGYKNDAFWAVFDAISFGCNLKQLFDIKNKMQTPTDISLIQPDILQIGQKKPETRSSEDWQKLSDCWFRLMQNLTVQRWCFVDDICNEMKFSDEVLLKNEYGQNVGLLYDSQKKDFLVKRRNFLQEQTKDYESIRGLGLSILGISCDKDANLHLIDSIKCEHAAEVIISAHNFISKYGKVNVDTDKKARSGFVKILCSVIFPGIEQVCVFINFIHLNNPYIGFNKFGRGEYLNSVKFRSKIKAIQSMARIIPQILMCKSGDKVRWLYVGLMLVATAKLYWDCKDIWNFKPEVEPENILPENRTKENWHSLKIDWGIENEIVEKVRGTIVDKVDIDIMRELAFKILGAKDKDFIEANSKFRKLSLKHHPDRGGDKEISQFLNDVHSFLENVEKATVLQPQPGASTSGPANIQINAGKVGDSQNPD